jgi:7-cyano-7-deazaguanine synthase in queuosine biosynthesis
MRDYQICNFCVMDTSDSEIVFDKQGICNHCRNARSIWDKIVFPHSYQIWAEEIFTNRSSNSVYDGILGLSGGVDSSYLLHLLVNTGINPLVVHVDAGWNSQDATSNIYKLVNKLNLHLETIVINWDSIKQLQIAYLNSGLKNQDVPQDHAFLSAIYRLAYTKKIKNVFVGTNWATESILPRSWAESAMDNKQIISVMKKFKMHNDLSFELMDPMWLFYNSRVAKKFIIHDPLNKIYYKKSMAVSTLKNIYDWKDYGGKHCESRFTSYYQEVYLPNRFGIVKKRAHLSSLIVNGEISRSEALKNLDERTNSEIKIQNTRKYVADKLDISLDQLHEFEKMDVRHLYDFKKSTLKILVIKVLTKLRSYQKKYLKQ